jgi:hypothetical protein
MVEFYHLNRHQTLIIHYSIFNNHFLGCFDDQSGFDATGADDHLFDLAL